MSRNCPICPSQPMHSFEFRRVHLDTCESCRGHWLDGGELERLVPDWSPEALLASLPEAPGRCRHDAGHLVPRGKDSCESCSAPVVRCPECDERLSHVKTEVCALEVCHRCHGLWLDTTELKQLTRRHKRSRRARNSQPVSSAVEAGGALEVAGALVDGVELVAVGADWVDGETVSEAVGAAVEVADAAGAVVTEGVGSVLEFLAGLFD